MILVGTEDYGILEFPKSKSWRVDGNESLCVIEGATVVAELPRGDWNLVRLVEDDDEDEPES